MLYRSVYNMNSPARPALAKKSAEKGAKKRWRFHAFLHMLTPILRHYHYELPTRIETDTSDGVVAGVLSQQDQQTHFWHPIAYFSKTMQPAELNYDIHDKEMLAIILSLEEWRAELEGLQHTPFTVYSDHRALEYFMTTKKLSARQARWAEYLSRYHFLLTYRTGKANERADALSRKREDLLSQGQVMTANRTQVLFPLDKVTDEVVRDLQLAPLEPSGGSQGTIKAARDPPQALANPLMTPVSNGLELIDKLLNANRTAPELEELQVKARTEVEDTWQLRDGLLLRYGKLYVPD